MQRYLILHLVLLQLFHLEYGLHYSNGRVSHSPYFTRQYIRRSLLEGRRSTAFMEPLSPRIIGGSLARHGDAPYTLSLQLDGRTHRCGAVLTVIENVQVALTAAHCAMVIYPDGSQPSWRIPPERISLLAGNVRLRTTKNWEQRRNVTKVVYHDYDEQTQENDIAILFLNAPFRLNTYISTIGLPNQGQQTTSGTVIVSGWGKSDKLQYVEVPVVNRDKCRKAYKNILQISDTMICGGSRGKGACAGDSGGPAVTRQGVYLAGISSWGYDCGNSKHPSVFTEVSNYVDWIREQVRYNPNYGQRYTYSSYRKIPLCQSSDPVRYPTSLKEVVNIVKEAISRKTTVKAFGARHSQTDIICTEGIPVDTHGLRDMKYNSKDKTATLGAGVIMYDATTFLKRYKRALLTTPAYGNITMAGAVGTGAHGSSINYNSSISSQVVGLTVVDGLGQVRKISGAEDLLSFRMHLGLLGFVVDVTVDTHPMYKTRAENRVWSDEILTNGVLEEFIDYADQMSVYWFPFQRSVITANWSIVPANTPGNAYTADHVPPTRGKFNHEVKFGAEAIQVAASHDCPAVAAAAYKAFHVFESYTKSTLYKYTPWFLPIYTEDGVTLLNPAVGDYDKMFAPTCKDDDHSDVQCIWGHGLDGITLLDYEFTFPIRRLPEFVERVKDILTKVPTGFVMQGILMRFSHASEEYMSTAYGEDSVHFEYYMLNRNNVYKDPSAGLAAYQAIQQIAVEEFNARAHWGKNGLAFHSKDKIIAKLDPRARARFIETMNKYDPNGVFMNNFGKRLKGVSSIIDIDPKTTKCGLLDNCICSKDSDCGDTQYCGTIQGYNVHVCRTRNDEQVVKLVDQLDFPIGRDFSLGSFFKKTIGHIKEIVGLGVCVVKGVTRTVTNTIFGGLGIFGGIFG